MNIQVNNQVNNICYTGKWNIFNVFGMRRAKSFPIEQADTFIRTTEQFNIDFKNIKKGDYLNSGNDAVVFMTNNKDYVLRILRNKRYIPEELFPVQDGNGLIVARNPRNTVQLQKYVKGNPLYGKHWDVLYSNISKEEYFEYFNKIKDLPDESFTEYMNRIVDIRKCGYDTDPLNPNNILLDGEHLNIVDIEKSATTHPTIIISDFFALVDYFHIRKITSTMNKEEKTKFIKDLEIFFNRMVSIANKEGYNLDKNTIPKLNQIL